MHRGCISLGDVRCDGCHRMVRYLERYLVIEEAEGDVLRLCLDCALKRGYAHPETEKGEEVMTFFPEPKYGQ
jgi:hypothetical protein